METLATKEHLEKEDQVIGEGLVVEDQVSSQESVLLATNQATNILDVLKRFVKTQDKVEKEECSSFKRKMDKALHHTTPPHLGLLVPNKEKHSQCKGHS